MSRAKDIIMGFQPVKTLTVQDFCDDGDFLFALSALGAIPQEISVDDAPYSLYSTVLKIQTGVGDYRINRDLMCDWPALMRRWHESEDLDEIAIALDQPPAKT